MRTKIIYTLVCGHSDTYLEQLMVSAYSVRLYNSDAEIVLVVDKETKKNLAERELALKEFISEIICIETPFPEDKMRSSRYLKTNLRRFVKGDYLFIDCDTVICESLSDIDKITIELGMVADLNGSLPLTEKTVLEKCKKAGFENVEGEPYFNSGVIYAKDTPNVHRFYEEWYRQWQYSDARGVAYDQPALCKTNINLGCPVQELSGKWNCQIKYYGSSFLNEAKIMHYYSNNAMGGTNYSQDCIFEYVKEHGRVDAVVDRMIHNPRTIFYTALTISPDKAFEFFNSEMLYYFFNLPPLYRILAVFAKILAVPMMALVRLKRKI